MEFQVNNELSVVISVKRASVDVKMTYSPE